MPTARRPHWSRQYPPTRPSVRIGRRSAAAVLVASALAGITAYSVGGYPSSVDLAAAQCDRPTATRQLAAARQVRTDARALLAELRLEVRDDPRARALSRQISDLGFIPSQHRGWRQKAVDVSDQLSGTKDPKLRAVALTLARNGYGPTPADLLGDPPPSDQGPGLGQVLGQGTAPSLDGAVDGAADAAGRLLQPPAPAGASDPSKPSQRKRAGSAEPPLPQVCGSGSTAPAAATPTTSERPPPTASPTPARSTSSPTSATATADPQLPVGDPENDSAGDRSQPASRTSEPPATAPPNSSATSTPASSDAPASDTSNSGSAQPVDLEQARAAIQLLGELMQALGAADGEQESTQLKDLLEQAISSGQPQLQPVGREPTGSGEQETPTTSDDSDQDGPATSQGGSGDGGWKPAADKLAEQASEAAASDPLAKQLVDELRDAGVDVPEQGSGSSDPSTPSSTPSESGDQTDKPDDSTDSPSSSTPTPDTPENSDQTNEPDDSTDSGAPADQQAGGGEQPQDPAGNPNNGGQQGAGADEATWDKLADCESSGDWSADTGNGYSGGLQFSPETWEAFGGSGDPAAASREQQIAVAEKVQAEQGWNAWPSCSKKLGL